MQFFISHLASWLRTCRFSEPTFRPTGATNHWKNIVFRDFPTCSRICIFFLLMLSLLTLLTSAFQLSILSEVSHLNFLRQFKFYIYIFLYLYFYYIFIEPAVRVSPFHPQTKTNSDEFLEGELPPEGKFPPEDGFRRRIAPRRRIPPEDELPPEDEFPPEDKLRRRIPRRRVAPRRRIPPRKTNCEDEFPEP